MRKIIEKVTNYIEKDKKVKERFVPFFKKGTNERNVKVKKHLIKNYINYKKLIIKKFFKKNKEKTDFLFDLVAYCFLYGLPINFMLWVIFSMSFSIYFIAYGFLYYLIKEEFPQFLNK